MYSTSCERQIFNLGVIVPNFNVNHPSDLASKHYKTTPANLQMCSKTQQKLDKALRAQSLPGHQLLQCKHLDAH